MNRTKKKKKKKKKKKTSSRKFYSLLLLSKLVNTGQFLHNRHCYVFLFQVVNIAFLPKSSELIILTEEEDYRLFLRLNQILMIDLLKIIGIFKVSILKIRTIFKK